MSVPPQIRDTEKLCPCIRGRYRHLVDIAMARGIYLVTIETLRHPDRQKYYVRIRVSWTLKSKHLSQPPFGLSLAVDCVPQDYLTHPLWNPEGVQWEEVGEIAETLGLHWAGRWKKKRV